MEIKTVEELNLFKLELIKIIKQRYVNREGSIGEFIKHINSNEDTLYRMLHGGKAKRKADVGLRIVLKVLKELNQDLEIEGLSLSKVKEIAEIHSHLLNMTKKIVVRLNNDLTLADIARRYYLQPRKLSEILLDRVSSTNTLMSIDLLLTFLIKMNRSITVEIKE
jgi:hypothetical protein